ncbi:MAG TPA: T9SS type A sorting domain-containing protein [Bacteroidia bacterium]|jgi:hypothetical protein|nr:T9SS type A sorting domain-containing protein [Bacteroidia bacterium]
MRFFIFCFCLLPLLSDAQFAPPVGQAGTTAMYKDSSAFINWASFCNVIRGLKDISNSAGGNASVGDSSKAIGIADNSVVSLGDGGIAVCTFQYAITDGPGPDFAVFENAFNDDYLELGFVEVSSDGINFFRFPATSNTQDTMQTGSFGSTDAKLINNLGGKYRVLYGTPFDLQELQGISGLNINHVTHVKIIDVVGDINPSYATYDKNNHKVNDPWPTAFASGGFDLDAVGVIHDITNSIKENEEEFFVIYPNPAKGIVNIGFRIQNSMFELNDFTGRKIELREQGRKDNCVQFDISGLTPGIYFIKLSSGEKCFSKKIIIAE